MKNAERRIFILIFGKVCHIIHYNYGW
jgi:hypothetical protein